MGSACARLVYILLCNDVYHVSRPLYGGGPSLAWMAGKQVMGADNEEGGGSHSSWRAEDLLDLERCGLAADLASTNLGPGHDDNACVWGQSNQDLAFNTCDMRCRPI